MPRFSELPVASALSGDETVAVVQAGDTKRTTAAQLAALGGGGGGTVYDGGADTTDATATTLIEIPAGDLAADVVIALNAAVVCRDSTGELMRLDIKSLAAKDGAGVTTVIDSWVDQLGSSALNLTSLWCVAVGGGLEIQAVGIGATEIGWYGKITTLVVTPSD